MKKVLKRIITFTLVIVMLFTSVPFTGGDLQVSAIDGRVEQAVQTAIAIANDNSHGYSQTSRQGPDYDCSSLVYYAFSSAGFSFSPTWFNTRTMGSALTNAGFVELTNIDLSNSNSLQRGDILWKSGHTEIYIGNNQLVGAHSDRGYPQTGDQPGNEISVENYYYKGSNGTVWTKVYRYGGADTSKPIISDVGYSNPSNDSFTINCTINDNIGVTRVWLNIYGPSGSDGYAVATTNGNFSHTISTEKFGGAGEYSVHIYAFDAAGNSSSTAINNIKAISDNEKPTISDFYSSDESASSFTINCILSDNVDVSRVWLNIYGPSGSDGYAVATTNGKFSHTISTEKFGGAGEYSVHVYAFDPTGNSSSIAINGIKAIADIEKPTISEVYSSNETASSFTINCILSDNVDVSRVWLNIYGPSGSDGYAVATTNGNFSHAISTEKFGGAGEYAVHIYAFDAEGNETSYAINNIYAYDNYTIYYNLNSGENAPESQMKKHNKAITLSTQIPIRDGFTFLGWSTDSSATVPEYLPGDTYSENSDVTLFAVWEEVVGAVTVQGLLKTFGDSENEITIELIKTDETEAIYFAKVFGNSSEFSIGSVEVGEYILRVSKANHVTREYSVTVGEEDVELDIQLNLIGDLNGDGKVNTLDVARANAHTRGTASLAGYEFACVDVNGDGKVNTLDVAKMNGHAKGVSSLW